nr:hypothetical protein [Tanacetum cinerariifolium]
MKCKRRSTFSATGPLCHTTGMVPQRMLLPPMAVTIINRNASPCKILLQSSTYGLSAWTGGGDGAVHRLMLR